MTVNTPQLTDAELAAMAALDQEARDNWDDPRWHKEMAAQIIDAIDRGFQHERLINILSTTEDVAIDDEVYIEETRGLRTFMLARGGYIEESSLTANRMKIPRYLAGYHISELEDKMLSNFAVNTAKMTQLGIQSMDAFINSFWLRLFQKAYDPTSPYYFTTAGFSLQALSDAVRAVQDETNDPAGVRIVGRVTMTGKLYDAQVNNNAGFLPETNEEVRRTGKIGTFHGATVVELRNYRDDLGFPFFPANELYVVSNDASKFAFFGAPKGKEFIEQDAWVWHLLSKREWGGAVVRPDKGRRIVDSSTPAYSQNRL